MQKIIYILGILCLSVLNLSAQDVRFTLSGPQAVELGEIFSITYTVNAQGSGFRGPEFSHFDYLAGPSTSSSSQMSWINGKMTSSHSVSYSYQLQAIETGTFTLPAATISVDNKKYKSNTLTITVVKGSSASGNQQQSRQQQSKTTPQTAPQKPEKIPQSEAFAKSIASKKKVYVGEPILLTQKIYSQQDIRDISDFKESSYKGFWKEDIDIGQLQTLRESYNNKVYNALTLRKVLLFPQKSGKLRISPFHINMVTAVSSFRRPRNQWEAWMYGNKVPTAVSKNIQLTSKAVNIVVKDLPDKGKPASFNGAVGKYSMQALLDKDQVNVNDAITLKIKLTGRGNIDLLDISKPQFPSDFEVYDPKISTKSNNSITGVNGSKTAEYLIIPRNEGNFVIPPLEFSYFDPDQERYITLHSDTFHIRVGKGSGRTISSGSPEVNRKEVSRLSKDIRYINTRDFSLQQQGQFFCFSPWFFTLLILIPLLSIAFIILSKQSRQRRSNVRLMKTRRATRVARKRLKNAHTLLSQSNKSAFYEEISGALWGYLSDKFNIPRADLSMDNVKEVLEGKKLPGTLIEQIIQLLNTCEYARFAPGSAADDKSLYNEAVETISNMENNLK